MTMGKKTSIDEVKIKLSPKQATALREEVMSITFEDDIALMDYLEPRRNGMDDDEFLTWIQKNYTEAFNWDGNVLVIDCRKEAWKELLQGLAADADNQVESLTEKLPDYRGDREYNQILGLRRTLKSVQSILEAALNPSTTVEFEVSQ